MKVKFLVPEIDKARWAEKFKEELSIFKLKSKELSEIGAETICPQRINKYKNGAIQKIDTFLTICRFFTSLLLDKITVSRSLISFSRVVLSYLFDNNLGKIVVL